MMPAINYPTYEDSVWQGAPVAPSQPLTPSEAKRAQLRELRARSRRHREYSRLLVWAPFALLVLLSCLATIDSDPFGLVRFIATFVAPPCWALSLFCKLSARRLERISKNHGIR